MRTKFIARPLAGMIVFCSLTPWAADNTKPFDIKVGLWEETVTRTIKGIPSHPIPANLSPEEHARAEARMKGEPVTDVGRSCICLLYTSDAADECCV